MEIISDRYDMATGEMLGVEEADGVCISAYHGPFTDENVEFYKSDKIGSLTGAWGNVWSYVAKPATGDIWWTVSEMPPAQHRGFAHLNLFDELAEMELVVG